MDHSWYAACAYLFTRRTCHVHGPMRRLTRSQPKMSVGHFAILANVGSTQAITMPRPMEILGNQVCVGPACRRNTSSGTLRLLSLEHSILFQT